MGRRIWLHIYFLQPTIELAQLLNASSLLSSLLSSSLWCAEDIASEDWAISKSSGFFSSSSLWQWHDVNVDDDDLGVTLEKRHNCICLTFSDKWGFMKRRRESVNNHMCIAIDGFGQWKQKSSSSSGTAQQPTIEFAPVLAFKCTSIKVPIFLPTHHFAFSAGTHLNKPTKVRFLELSKL